MLSYIVDAFALFKLSELILIHISMLAMALIAVGVAMTVISVDDNSIAQLVAQENIILMLFYSPNCPHCNMFQPIYESTQQYFSMHYPSIPCTFAKIDASKNTKSLDDYGLQVYPTLKLIINQTLIIEYHGERKEQQISEWIVGMTKLPYTVINESEFAQLKDQKNTVVVLTKMDYKLLKEYSLKWSMFKFIAVKNFTKNNIIHFINTTKGEYETIDLSKSKLTLNQLLQVRAISEYDNFNQKYAELLQEGLPTIAIIGNFFHEDTLALEKRLIKEIRNQNDYIFIRVNKKDPLSKTLIDYLGVDRSYMPCIMLLHKLNDRFYKYMMKPNQQIAEFIEKYETDSLPIWYKSQPEPPMVIPPFLKIVGTSFKRLVLNSNYNILVIHELPQTGAGVKLRRIIDKMYKVIPSMNLSIGMFDSDKNEYEGMRSHESIFVDLYVAGRKGSAIPYYCYDCEYSDLYSFLHKHIPSVDYQGYVKEGYEFSEEI